LVFRHIRRDVHLVKFLDGLVRIWGRKNDFPAVDRAAFLPDDEFRRARDLQPWRGARAAPNQSPEPQAKHSRSCWDVQQSQVLANEAHG